MPSGPPTTAVSTKVATATGHAVTTVVSGAGTSFAAAAPAAVVARIDAMSRAQLQAAASGGKLKKYGGVKGTSSNDDIRAALKQAALAAMSPAALLASGTALATQAVAADKAQDYARARELYHRAEASLLQWVKRAPDQAKKRPAMLARMKGYQRRLETLDVRLATKKGATPSLSPSPPPSGGGQSRQNAGNVNIVARHNSARLVGNTDKIRAAQADAIVAERWLNGPFAGWADLLKRMKGRGVAKVTVDKLKLRGWDVKPVKDANAGGCDLRKGKHALRLNVGPMAEPTWRLRGGVCLYTQLKQAAVVQQKAEVDHVWECQLLDVANRRAAEGKGAAARTRAVQDTLGSLVNSTTNLNVTTHKVNQAKKGPFTKFQHRYEAGKGVLVLDDLVSEAEQNVRDLRDDGTWARITDAVVMVHGELKEQAEQIANRAAREHAGRFLAELGTMLGKMDVL